MTVDIVVRKEPSYNVIAKAHVGSYSGDDMLRDEFDALMKWARKNGAKTGKWFFYELDDLDTPDEIRKWEACIEVKAMPKVKLPRDIVSKELPAQLVASVTFDPDKVSPRLVYHGVEGWLKWRTKFREFEEAGPTREVYLGDPWTNKKAWAKVDIQVPVRRIKPTKL